MAVRPSFPVSLNFMILKLILPLMLEFKGFSQNGSCWRWELWPCPSWSKANTHYVISQYKLPLWCSQVNYHQLPLDSMSSEFQSRNYTHVCSSHLSRKRMIKKLFLIWKLKSLMWSCYPDLRESIKIVQYCRSGPRSYKANRASQSWHTLKAVSRHAISVHDCHFCSIVFASAFELEFDSKMTSLISFTDGPRNPFWRISKSASSSESVSADDELYQLVYHVQDRN